MLQLLASNQESFIALGALIYPIMAILAAFVSYRAVATGPGFSARSLRSMLGITLDELHGWRTAFDAYG
jgi:hypothetical protein